MKKVINMLSALFSRGVWAANSAAEGVHGDGAASFEASAAIARGQIVSIDGGKIKPATGPTAPTAGNSKYCVGIAVSAASAAGDEVEFAHCVANKVATPAS